MPRQKVEEEGRGREKSQVEVRGQCQRAKADGGSRGQKNMERSEGRGGEV